MEPMMMGSPNGSPLLVSSAASGYLPSYLMGEPPTSSRSNTLSPTKMRSSMSDPNRSAVQQQMMQNELEHSVHIAHDYLNQTAVNHNTISGPPTMGLYESYRNEKIMQLNTPTTGSVSFDKGPHNETPLHNQSGFNLSRVLSPIPVPLAATEVEDVRRAASPSQSMMFNLSSAPHKNGNYWVTVYGFPETACKTILAHFSRCGNVMDTRFAANSNWMHIRYSSRHECDKAINYNGRIVGPNLMIGVKNCTDPEVVSEGTSGEATRRMQMRSLSHVAYHNAQNDISIAPSGNNHPKLENGFMQKAMDLFFSW